MRQVTPQVQTISSPPGAYEVLKPLSLSNAVELCRERATGRLLVRKQFTAEAREFFEREATNLHTLRGFSGAPNLYFAWTNADGSSVLGREFLPGTSLCAAIKPMTERHMEIARSLYVLVRELHDKFGMSHGDLSPKNVVLMGASNDQVRLGLLDWEFARKFHDESMESYASYRGSLGFTELGSDTSLREKDQKALSECIRLLGCSEEMLQLSISPLTKKTEKRRWRWT